MCGIVGYIGHRDAGEVLPRGLRELQYRGYDAAGIALLDRTGKCSVVKKILKSKTGVGAADELVELLTGRVFQSPIGICHTRWPTHGQNTIANAHPQTDCCGTIFVVHNGIVDNFLELERELSGHRRISETDTELIAHLIEEEYIRTPVLLEATKRALERVSGTYALAIMSIHHPDLLVVACHGSPLKIGRGEGETFVASDEAAIVPWTARIIDLQDGDVAEVQEDGVVGETRPERISLWDVSAAQKGGYPHFMLKEIMEEADTVRMALNHGGRLLPETGDAKLGGFEEIREELRNVERVIFVAAGTAFHAALTGVHMMRSFGGIHYAEAHQASEVYGDTLHLTPKQDLVIAVSQSGETKDTIDAVTECKRKGVVTLGVINRVGSTLARLCGRGVYCNAGPEISVASTKAYVSQLVVLGLMSLFLGRQRNLGPDDGRELVIALTGLPKQVEEALAQHGQISGIAQELIDYERFLFIGRGWHYPVALEGALKLKEITYRTAEGYAAGEMKHGPLAMLDEHVPTIALAPNDAVFELMVGNLMEAKGRGSPLLLVTTPCTREQIGDLGRWRIEVPETHPMLQPIISVLPLQLLAYSLAVALGRDVDQPRNLAKSVTVR